MAIRRQRLYYNLIQVNGNFLFYPKQANTARQQCYNNTGIKVLISYKNILLTLDENRKEFLIYIYLDTSAITMTQMPGVNRWSVNGFIRLLGKCRESISSVWSILCRTD